ncbi:MAG: UvrB/UvrC motif-containing protein [Clostridia bacterium]|nr:UvrB/UvrC motif-containing protein [Clostridia bacterium]
MYNNRKCDNCKKQNATVHFRQNINGKVTESYLCSDCAAKAGYTADSFFSSWNPFEGFDKMLGGFFLPQSTSAAVCPTCGRTLSDVKRSGRFGCSDCYPTFADRLDLSPFTGSVYRGRRPAVKGATLGERIREHAEKNAEKKAEKAEKIKTADEIASLKSELKAAVANEEYEKAATLRDRIRAIENGEAR